MNRLLWPELEPESVGEGWIAELPESRVTSAEVVAALASRHPTDGYNGVPGRWVFASEVQAATGSYSDVQRFDAVAVGLVPSVKYARVVYEVKVSRADWLRELKPLAKLVDRWGERRLRPAAAEFYRLAASDPENPVLAGGSVVEFRKFEAALEVSTEFWIAAPPHVVMESELPPEAGLVEVRPWGPDRVLRPRVVRKAPVRETPNPGPEFWASMLRRVASR